MTVICGNQNRIRRQVDISMGGGQPFPWIQEATFELGLTTPNPTGFDNIMGVAGNFTVIVAAAMQGILGLQNNIVAGSEVYGEFLDPNNESTLTFEFLLDPHTLAMAVGDSFFFVTANGDGTGGAAFIVNIKNVAGLLTLQFLARTDAGGNVTIGNTNILTQAQRIKIEWQQSSAPGADDGFMRVYRNENLLFEVTGIDNDGHNYNSIRMGTIAGIDAGSSGLIFIDDPRWARVIQ